MTDLALYTPPSASDLEQSWQLADRIARTEFVPPALRGKPEAVLACVLAGRELGIGPIQALQSIHVIQGRPTISADLMAGLVRRHGHRIRTLERTNDRVTVEGVRADDPGHTERVTFSMEDAKRAGLVGKDNWRQYPAAMLWARAVSALCRVAFNDVLHGVAYTPEELGDTAVEVGPVEPVQGVLADGWTSYDEQNEAHRRLNVYLANNGLGSWYDRWLAARSYRRPLSTSQMDELRRAFTERAQTARGGAGSDGTATPSPTSSGEDFPSDASSPSALEQEEASELARSRAEGANQDGKPDADAEAPNSDGVTTASEVANSPGSTSGASKRARSESSKGKVASDRADPEQPELDPARFTR